MIMSVKLSKWFQHTAARRRLAMPICSAMSSINRFNTQPPEGGWTACRSTLLSLARFQHTAARRRLAKPALTASSKS